MIKVGLTGGMGTGKATVARFFAALGAVVVDADRLAREAVLPGRGAWRSLVEQFGRDMLNADGTIDRRRLADAVFGKPEQLKILNSIVHPPVIEEMRRRFTRAGEKGECKVVVADVPLLFEAGLEGEFDRIIVVTCPREEQIRRTRARNGLSRDEVERRLNAQMPIEEKVRRADYRVDNKGSLEDTRMQVEAIWSELTESDRCAS